MGVNKAGLFLRRSADTAWYGLSVVGNLVGMVIILIIAGLIWIMDQMFGET